MADKPPPNPFLIDENNLHTELVELPGKTRDAGIREADARHAYNMAKARLDVTRARILLAVRKNPEAFDLRAKPNEAEVDATVDMHPDVKRDTDALYDAQRAKDYAEVDTTAMLATRKSVERLVELLQLNYYSEREPTATTRGGREKMDDMRRRAIRGGGDNDD